MFEAVGKNRAKTIFIVLGIFIFLMLIMELLLFHVLEFGRAFVLVAIVISALVSFGTYWNSHKIVLSLHRARPATPEQDAKLNNILEGLCLAAGMPKPALYVMDDPALNAFATGRNHNNAVICVTTGLLEKLDYYQLEGVVAHELAHIKNYDILLQTVAGIMVGAAIIAARMATRSLMFGGSGGGRSRGGRSSGSGAAIIMVVGIVFAILAPIAGQMLKMLLSRNREYLADATAASLTRNPEGLAGALEVISGSAVPLRYANDATEGLYIATPRAELDGGKAASLFSTHPPIESRVEALRNFR